MVPPNMVTRWRRKCGRGRINLVRVDLVLFATLPSGPWGRAAPHLGAGGGGGGRRGKGRGRESGDEDWVRISGGVHWQTLEKMT